MNLTITRLEEGVLTSADSATLTLSTSDGDDVVADVAVSPTSAGKYSYDTPYLVSGVYQVTWTFVKTGRPDENVYRTFQVTSPIVQYKGVTLMELEERLARRTGPYYKYSAAAESSQENLVVDRLLSSINIGGLEDLYLLRRGVYMNGGRIFGFIDSDRYRTIASFDPLTGTVTPDRNWVVAPQETERIEMIYLDPEQQLRPAMLEGLERCYYWETALITTTGAVRTRDLQELLPWLKAPTDLVDVGYSIPGDVTPRTSLFWFNSYNQDGSIQGDADWTGPGNLAVTALRSHSTFVNGETSLEGPVDDFDVLNVDPEYAVRAGHVQAWVNFPDRMTPAAAQGLRLTATQVAQAFTQRSIGVYNQKPPERLRLRFENEALTSQVGNAWGE